MTTATRAPATLSDGDRSTAVARALAPEITQRADDAEALGKMPIDLVERLARVGSSAPCNHARSAPLRWPPSSSSR